MRQRVPAPREIRHLQHIILAFRAPLGAWICVWGCGAMLTSAPFDNWWHNAYGLDVRIISPPHAVLAIGIYSIVVGGLLLALARQNRAEVQAQRRLAWVLAGTGGLSFVRSSDTAGETWGAPVSLNTGGAAANKD